MTQGLNLEGNDFVPCITTLPSGLIPEEGVVLYRTPFIDPQATWINFFDACKKLKMQMPHPKYVYLDAAWDPVTITDEEIISRRIEVGRIFPESKICVLSSKAEHYFSEIPGILYLPYFLTANYGTLQPDRPRQGRIGCLNRRNSAYRTYLMNALLKEKLLDPAHDVYSVSFTGLLDDSYWDLRFWIDDGARLNEEVKQWPKKIATHPDNFPNDYSVEHSAWHTGISIITETEVGNRTLLSEKTGKGILSKSCFSIYMGDVGYKVLEDLWFVPRFFDSHAEEQNIDPILNICRMFHTAEQALDYRQQHIDQIEHNFNHFSYGTPFVNCPWFNRYNPKLQRALNNL